MEEKLNKEYLNYLDDFQKFVEDFEEVTIEIIKSPNILQYIDVKHLSVYTEIGSISSEELSVLNDSLTIIKETRQQLATLTEQPAINFIDVIKSEFKISEVNLYDSTSGDFLERILNLLKNYNKESKIEDRHSNSFTANVTILYKRYFEQLNLIMNKVSLLKILSNLTNVTKNSVLIGANGSGKSSFAQQIKKINSKNLMVISAQKFLFFDETTRSPLNHNAVQEFREGNKSNEFPQATNDKYNPQVNQQLKRYFTNEYSELLNTLESEHLGKAHEQKINNKPKTESILEKVIRIWETVIPHRKLLMDKFPIVAYDSVENHEYNFNLLSDGEKAVFYYIAMVLLAEENDYIIVDEPENHLNLSVLISLWNQLELEKPNCLFIYITHNIQFATSRRNFNIIWNKSFTAPDNWNVELIEPDNEIPNELIVELLGTQKDIIFCEGEKGNLDYNFLQALFGDQYTIIPAQGHLDVISITKAYNQSSLFTSKALAIIDRDYYEEEQLRAWKNHNVFSTSFLEIENIYVCEEILNRLSEQAVYESDKFELYREAVKEKVEEMKEELAIKYIKQKVNNKFRSNFMSKKASLDKLEEEIDGLFSEVSIRDLFEKRLEEIEILVESNNYEEIIRGADLKGVLTKELTSRVLNIPNYTDIVINLLNNDAQLKDIIKQKYFAFVED